MSEISELERRITAALDRIARDVDVLAQRPAGDGASNAAGNVADVEAAEGVAADPVAVAADPELTQKLEDERLANAQLQERLKSLRLKLDKKDSEAERGQRDLKSALAEMDGVVQALKKTSEQLRDSVETLRTANEAGVADSDAINAALAAELAALKAERAAEVAESGAILTALEPLLSRSEEKESA